MFSWIWRNTPNSPLVQHLELDLNLAHTTHVPTDSPADRPYSLIKIQFPKLRLHSSGHALVDYIWLKFKIYDLLKK
jgi:hypothetical protein